MAYEQVRGIRRVAYVAVALICLALGLLGAILPGLPTTPFLLLMSYLLVRSWPWLHQQVLRLPAVGNTLRDWDEHRGVRRGVKRTAVVCVLLAVAVVFLVASMPMPLKLTIAALALVGLTVIARLPTIDADVKAAADCENC